MDRGAEGSASVTSSDLSILSKTEPLNGFGRGRKHFQEHFTASAAAANLAPSHLRGRKQQTQLDRSLRLGNVNFSGYGFGLSPKEFDYTRETPASSPFRKKHLISQDHGGLQSFVSAPPLEASRNVVTGQWTNNSFNNSYHPRTAWSEEEEGEEGEEKEEEEEEEQEEAVVLSFGAGKKGGGGEEEKGEQQQQKKEEEEEEEGRIVPPLPQERVRLAQRRRNNNKSNSKEREMEATSSSRSSRLSAPATQRGIREVEARLRELQRSQRQLQEEQAQQKKEDEEARQQQQRLRQKVVQPRVVPAGRKPAAQEGSAKAGAAVPSPRSPTQRGRPSSSRSLSSLRPQSAGSLRPRSADPAARMNQQQQHQQQQQQQQQMEQGSSRSRSMQRAEPQARPRSASSVASRSSVSDFWRAEQRRNPEQEWDEEERRMRPSSRGPFESSQKVGGVFANRFGSQKYRPQAPWEAMEVTGTRFSPSQQQQQQQHLHHHNKDLESVERSLFASSRPMNSMLGASAASDYFTDPPFYRRVGFGVETVDHRELAASPHRRPHCLSCDHGGKQFKHYDFLASL